MAQKMALSKKQKQGRMIIIASLILLVVIAIFTFTLMEKPQITKEADNKKYKEAYKEDITISYIAPLSGDAGIWGQSLKKGFDFALQEYNKNPDSKYQLKVIYEDDGCDPTMGVNAFNKVIQLQDVKYITGTICSNVAMAVGEMVDSNDVLYIASGATNPGVVQQSDMIFRLAPDDTYDAKTSAEYAAVTLGDKTFGVAFANDIPTGSITKDAFKKTAEQYEGEIIEVVDFSVQDTDFKTVVSKLVAKNPDAVYVMAFPEQLPIFVKQLRILGFEGDILLYGPSAISEGIIDSITQKTDVYYAFPEEIRQTPFWNNYKNATGNDADILIGLGYDSFKLMKQAIDSCGEDTLCARDYILGLDSFASTRGTYGFDSEGDVTQVPYTVIALE